MNWLAILFALELGISPQYQSLNVNGELQQFDKVLDVGYVQMDIELTMFNFIFIGGKMKTGIQGTDNVTDYVPFELSSLFNTGIRFQGVELGWRHLCVHPIRPFDVMYNTNSSFDGGYNEYYLRMEVKL